MCWVTKVWVLRGGGVMKIPSFLKTNMQVGAQNHSCEGRKIRTRQSGLQGSEFTKLCSGRFKGEPKYKDICEKGKEREAGVCSTSPCSSKEERYHEKSDEKYSQSLDN